MKSPHAILIGHEVKPCNLMTWVRWFGAAGPGDRQVAVDKVADTCISTVFLGLDHAFGFGPPQWFETYVFDSGPLGGVMGRYSTWEEAEAGHAAILSMVQADANVAREAVSAALERIKQAPRTRL